MIVVTERAREDIRRTIADFESTAKANDFISDLEETLNLVGSNPDIGMKAGFTAYSDARCIHLNRYNGWLLVYAIVQEKVIVTNLLVSWMG